MNATKIHSSRALAGVVILLGAAIAGGGNASATPPALSCGATVTSNVRLRTDLLDCAGDGLVVGATGITIDLNGHVVDGDGVSGAESPDAGIRNSGFPGVTIKNGVAQQFDDGVDLSGATDNVLNRLDTRFNFAGAVLADGANSSVVEHVAAHDNTIGLLVVGVDDVRVERNNVIAGEFGGILAFDVSNSEFNHNTVGGVDLMGDGLVVDGGSNDNLVEHNSVTGVELPLIIGGERNTVTNNRLSANRGGLILVGDDNTADSNTISDALGCGPDGGCGIGVSVEGGSRNLVSRNRVSRTFDSAMRVDAYVGSATATVFRDNIIRDAGRDGIAIDLDQAGVVERTLVDGNRVSASRGDGIDVGDTTATLTDNRLTGNSGYGINAAEGVTDGGGNRATRNGNAAQCTPNIAC